ncbi:MAG: hypothetical protein HKN82_13010 [Akkermansiaceae bacterium]|nr:hypothetical protein [Akkermansiaceae bacterium]NNM28403.1 hypothetical protein [Akkermansiaceae bacterium]
MTPPDRTTPTPPPGFRRDPARRFAIIDFVVLAVGLALLNYFVSRDDPGWLRVNPTPILLIPVLLGVRYGFVAGLGGGAATAGLVLAARFVDGASGPVFDDAWNHRLTFALLPFFGALTGQLAESLRKRRHDLQQRNAALEEENARLEVEGELLVLAKHDLQQRLGLFGAESAALDENLEDLASATREAGPARLLAILHEVTRTRAAAVYHLPPGGPEKSRTLTRAAYIGDPSRFPDLLQSGDHHIIHEAIESERFLTQQSLWDPVPRRSPGYLMAYPIAGPEDAGSYVVVIQDLPFNNISPRTFSILKAICDWFKYLGVTAPGAGSGHRAIPQGDFFGAIETAVATHAEQAVPSLLVRLPFDLPVDVNPASAFKDLLAELPRTALLTSSFENGDRSILFLIPAVSDARIAEEFRFAFASFGNRLGLTALPEPRFHLTRPEESPQQLWGRLVATS